MHSLNIMMRKPETPTWKGHSSGQVNPKVSTSCKERIDYRTRPAEEDGGHTDQMQCGVPDRIPDRVLGQQRAILGRC